MSRSEILLPLWENLLDPDTLRPSLTRVGLYLCLHEMLVEMLIAFPESLRFDNHANEFEPQTEFRLSVVPVSHRKRTQALEMCWGWWKTSRALSDEDKRSFDQTADYRHELAHEAMTRLLLNDEDLWQHYFEKMVLLVVKIDDWWRNNGDKHAETNAEGPGHQIRQHLLMNRIVLTALIEAAIGDEESARHVFDEFRKQFSASDGGRTIP